MNKTMNLKHYTIKLLSLNSSYSFIRDSNTKPISSSYFIYYSAETSLDLLLGHFNLIFRKVAGNIKIFLLPNIWAIIVWINLIKSFFGSWPSKGPEFVHFTFNQTQI